MTTGQNRRRHRGSSLSGPFLALPHAYFRTPEFAMLSGRAVKLLLELAFQYSGSNNGDLCATFRVMRLRGFRSADQLQKARDELIDSGWIVVSSQGGRHAATLYALTFHRIDSCGGKIDIRPGPPSHLWRAENAGQRETVRHPRKSERRIREPTGIGLDHDTVHIRPPHGAELDRNTDQPFQN